MNDKNCVAYTYQCRLKLAKICKLVSFSYHVGRYHSPRPDSTRQKSPDFCRY